PLIGMCIIYWKIFQAAKFRIRRKAFKTDRSPPPKSTMGTTVTSPLAHGQHEVLLLSETPTLNHEIKLTETNKYQTFSPLQ
ncbi:unnamed protein product, partial [Rotaria socialis]